MGALARSRPPRELEQLPAGCTHPSSKVQEGPSPHWFEFVSLLPSPRKKEETKRNLTDCSGRQDSRRKRPAVSILECVCVCKRERDRRRRGGRERKGEVEEEEAVHGMLLSISRSLSHFIGAAKRPATCLTTLNTPTTALTMMGTIIPPAVRTKRRNSPDPHTGKANFSKSPLF